MCLLCDGYSEEQVKRATELRILTNGWSVEGVGPGPDDDPGEATWAYTVGLTETHGAPELVVTQMKYDAAGNLLNWAGERLSNGDSVDDLADAGVRCAPVHQTHLEGELFSYWGEYYERSPGGAEFVQLIGPSDLYCSDCQTKHVADLSDPFEEFPYYRSAPELS